MCFAKSAPGSLRVCVKQFTNVRQAGGHELTHTLNLSTQIGRNLAVVTVTQHQHWVRAPNPCYT
jgi:hypothetical protein